MARLYENKKQSKNKIMAILKEKGRITNHEIQQSLKISEATVTRYLEELEKDGKVIQKGGRGRSVYYIKGSHTV
jgi:predicted HTH transcriptional regulator